VQILIHPPVRIYRQTTAVVNRADHRFTANIVNCCKRSATLGICCSQSSSFLLTMPKLNRNTGTNDGVSVDTLNQQYAEISSDYDYQPPQYRQTAACKDMDTVSGWQVFKLFDTLTATATGMDLLPSWFLRIGAPFLHKPVTRLFNKSIATSTVPRQSQRLPHLSSALTTGPSQSRLSLAERWSESLSGLEFSLSSHHCTSSFTRLH